VNKWIGTSGFQYAEWKGSFYPEDLPAAKMLPFYAERFNTTEVNYTFHRIPAPKTITNLVPADPRNVSIYLKGAAKSHAFREAAQLRRHGRLLLRRCERIGVTAWPGLISTSAKFEEGRLSARAFYGIVAGEYAGSLRVSP
jgi:hypothetical protein